MSAEELVRIQPVMSEQDPTADYRKYPKGPSFLLIVILSSVVLLVVLAVGLLFVYHEKKTEKAHTPEPTPNSMLMPPFASTVDVQRV